MRLWTKISITEKLIYLLCFYMDDNAESSHYMRTEVRYEILNLILEDKRSVGRQFVT